jgi:hypothetical protein
MHRPETKIEKEMKILCKKPSQQTKSTKIGLIGKFQVCEFFLPTASAICGIKIEPQG